MEIGLNNEDNLKNMCMGASIPIRLLVGIADRRLIAAMAMQGMIASDDCSGCSFEFIAKNAVIQADALIIELNKGIKNSD